jgi:hypothetical protein
MTRILESSLVVLLLAGAAHAQFYTQTLPSGYETTDGNYNIGTFSGVPTLFNSAGTSVWQYIYRWTTFEHRCPLTLAQIELRRSSDANLAATTYPQVDVTLASSVFPHTAPSATFANNLGSDATLVFSGPVTIPAHVAGPTVPAPWLVSLPFFNPFPFDPNQQKDLVVEIRVLAGPGVAGASFILDGVFPSSAVSQSGHRSNGTATVREWFNPDAGLVCRITYALGNSVHLDLSLTTSGGGVGDLVYAVSNLPGGTIEGFTFVSLTPTSAFGIPFGRGPFFGLWPDALVFTILASPAAVYDPFHWVNPAGGLFPESPIIAPPGTLSAFAGMTFECASVALGPGLVLLGISPPRAITW